MATAREYRHACVTVWLLHETDLTTSPFFSSWNLSCSFISSILCHRRLLPFTVVGNINDLLQAHSLLLTLLTLTHLLAMFGSISPLLSGRLVSRHRRLNTAHDISGHQLATCSHQDSS